SLVGRRPAAGRDLLHRRVSTAPRTNVERHRRRDVLTVSDERPSLLRDVVSSWRIPLEPPRFYFPFTSSPKGAYLSAAGIDRDRTRREMSWPHAPWSPFRSAPRSSAPSSSRC